MDTKKLEIDEGFNQTELTSVEIDYEKYQRFLDESDISEAEKKQVIDALWHLIVNFVDLGIGVHPIQQAGAETTNSENDGLVEFQAAFEAVATKKPDQQLEGVDA